MMLRNLNLDNHQIDRPSSLVGIETLFGKDKKLF